MLEVVKNVLYLVGALTVSYMLARMITAGILRTIQDFKKRGTE